MKKHLSEDSTMYNVNRQQYGITARKDSKGDTDPQANTVSGLLKSNKKKPLQANTLNYLGFTTRKLGNYEKGEEYYLLGLVVVI